MTDVAARHEAVDHVGAGLADVVALGGVGVVGFLLALAAARHVREDDMRVAAERFRCSIASGSSNS